MAWIKGSSDVDNIATDFYNILTGSLAGSQRGSGQIGNGVTAGTGAWTDIDSSARIIRSTETMQPFRLPIQCYRGMPRFSYKADATTPNNDTSYNIEKGKPTFTGIYTGTNSNVFYTAYVTTANTTPGDLTNTVVTYTSEHSITGTSVKTATTVSGWTGITSTKALWDGVSLTLTLGASDTLTITNAPLYTRAYGTSYPDGIDYIPEIAKYIGTGASIGITSGSTNSFTQNVDYNTARWIYAHEIEPVTTNSSVRCLDWGSNGYSIGVHWITGGTPIGVGETYWVNNLEMYSVYGMCTTMQGGTSNPNRWGFSLLPMDYWDEVNKACRSSYNILPHVMVPARGYDGSRGCTNLTNTVFYTASPLGSRYINYWISVKPDKIVLLTRGDMAFSGYLTLSSLQKYTSTNTSTDAWNWCITQFPSYWTQDNPCIFYTSGKAVYSLPYYGTMKSALYSGGGDGGSLWSGAFNYNSLFAGYSMWTGAPAQNPNLLDSKWKLFPMQYYGGTWGLSAASGLYNGNTDNGIIATTRGIYYIAAIGWTSLDELVDTPTGDKYLLVDLVATETGPRYVAIKEE